MRRSKRMFDEYQSEHHKPDERYSLAYKKVQRIKGFYVHVLVYLLVNIFVICGNYYGNTENNQNFWSWVNFNAVFVWGIGLLAHGFLVFGKNMFFGQNWEERKIQEFMDNDKREKWE